MTNFIDFHKSHTEISQMHRRFLMHICNYGLCIMHVIWCMKRTTSQIRKSIVFCRFGQNHTFAFEFWRVVWLVFRFIASPVVFVNALLSNSFEMNLSRKWDWISAGWDLWIVPTTISYLTFCLCCFFCVCVLLEIMTLNMSSRFIWSRRKRKPFVYTETPVLVAN